MSENSFHFPCPSNAASLCRTQEAAANFQFGQEPSSYDTKAACYVEGEFLNGDLCWSTGLLAEDDMERPASGNTIRVPFRNCGITEQKNCCRASSPATKRFGISDGNGCQKVWNLKVGR